MVSPLFLVNVFVADVDVVVDIVLDVVVVVIVVVIDRFVSEFVGAFVSGFAGEYVGGFVGGFAVHTDSPVRAQPKIMNSYINKIFLFFLTQLSSHRDAVSPKIGEGLFLRVASRRK